MDRIPLSIPHLEGHELSLVAEAFRSNWMSTAGPQLEALEREFAAAAGAPAALAVASGTAALHLGLRLLGVCPGDEVFSPTLTFVASVNPITYLGAKPVFIDSDPDTFNLDPARLAEALESRARRNRLPRAVVVVHLYGQSAQLGPILELCNRYEVPVLEDAAEALGTLYRGKQVGSFGALGAFSLNGNKIITATSGGVLAGPAGEIARARKWSTQAREPVPWYEHTELGYNYRMSNVLAAIARGQLQVLDKRVMQRRAVAQTYRTLLSDVPGFTLMPHLPFSRETNWLSVFLIDEARFGCSRDRLIAALDAAGIESRPVWKPMHLQPLYAHAERFGGEVAEDLFRRGICLPSSSSLSPEAIARVVQVVRAQARVSPPPPFPAPRAEAAGP